MEGVVRVLMKCCIVYICLKLDGQLGRACTLFIKAMGNEREGVYYKKYKAQICTNHSGLVRESGRCLPSDNERLDSEKEITACD